MRSTKQFATVMIADSCGWNSENGVNKTIILINLLITQVISLSFQLFLLCKMAGFPGNVANCVVMNCLKLGHAR